MVGNVKFYHIHLSQQYYAHIEEIQNSGSIRKYLVISGICSSLQNISYTAEQAKKLILEKKEISPEDYLLPRREEILNIIRDHKLVNFDQIRRRFKNVNERTLRYDLKKLADEDLVKKRGTTRGVYYEAKG